MTDTITKILDEVFRFGVGTNSPDIKGDETAYTNLKKHAIAEAATALQAEIIKAKIEEREKKILPEYDHTKCFDKRSCGGYMNAESDLYNETAIRINELEAELKQLEGKK